MPIIKLVVSVFILLILSACSQRHWQVQGKAVEASKASVFALHFTKNDIRVTWVCYTEIENHILQAASCQNDTALPLFSAGRTSHGKNQDFEFSYVSKRLMLVSPENTLAYLQIALYPDYNFAKNKSIPKQLEIHKSISNTRIIDSLSKLNLEIERL